MLETLRIYGLERLHERGEAARVREKHAAYFLSLAEVAGEALRGPEQAVWLSRLEVEHGNFRAALEWSLDQGAAETAARLAGSLYALWDLHGHYGEGRGWLAQVLQADDQLPAAVRARALLGSATLAVIQGTWRVRPAPARRQRRCAGRQATPRDWPMPCSTWDSRQSSPMSFTALRPSWRSR